MLCIKENDRIGWNDLFEHEVFTGEYFKDKIIAGLFEVVRSGLYISMKKSIVRTNSII